MTFTTTKRVALPVIAALFAMTAMLTTGSATATHVRPVGATPYYSQLVLAYDKCTPPVPPGNAHDPAIIGGGACSPPSKTSTLVTACAVDVAPACATGFRGAVHYRLAPGGGNIDWPLSFVQDVRCDEDTDGAGPDPGLPPGHPACTAAGAANAPGPPDYTGFLSGKTVIRITDHNNSTTGSPYTTPGTVADVSFEMPWTCAVTGPGTGARCIPAATN